MSSFIIFKLMRQKKTIALAIGFIMCGIMSLAASFPFSKLDVLNSQSEQKGIVSKHSGKLPLEEDHSSTNSIPRASLEEDEDDTSKEKILMKITLGHSGFLQQLYSTQNVFDALDLEILTPPPQE